MSHFRLLLAAASVLALVACAPTPPTPPTASLTPAAEQSAVAEPSGSAESSSAGTSPTDSAAAQDSGTAVGPGGVIWLKPGTPNERYRADADDCYSYAQAQINHDARMESDADAAFGGLTGNSASTALRQQMSQYGRDKRLPRLFGQCMEAKGYTRG